MSERHAPRKMHADEILVDDSLVRRLVDQQFPQWAGLPLDRVPSTGTDNAIYRLGNRMGVRLPRIERASRQVDKEWDWLARLGPQLSIPVPIPLARGKPDPEYPCPWLVYPWITGEDLQHASGIDLDTAARGLAAFVLELQEVGTGGRPPPGRRAGSLKPLDEQARWAINRLDGVVDADRAVAVWESALLAEPWTRPAVWTHGDLLAANIIVAEGKLAGVIDWDCAGIGDPACDAQLAWFFPPEQRAAFAEALALDDPTWARARGWVVWQTAMFIPYYAETLPDAVETAKLRLQAVLADSGR